MQSLKIDGAGGEGKGGRSGVSYRPKHGALSRLSFVPMDPTLSGFALGLLLAAAKVGAIGTVAFGIAWWRTRKKLQRLEAALPDPASLAERLASLEQMADFSASRMEQLIESQDALARQIAAPPAKASLPEPR